MPSTPRATTWKTPGIASPHSPGTNPPPPAVDLAPEGPSLRAQLQLQRRRLTSADGDRTEDGDRRHGGGRDVDEVGDVRPNILWLDWIGVKKSLLHVQIRESWLDIAQHSLRSSR